MKNKILLLTMIISTAIVFASCTNNDKTVQTSASPKEISGYLKTNEDVERLQLELYPAYIMDESEKRWGYINEEGKFIIKPKYESAADFQSNGMAEVLENGRWGLIDKSGKLIMESQYLYTINFSEKKIVSTGDSGKSYLLDEKGNILFQTDGSIDKLSCGMAAFSKVVDRDKSLWGYINDEGKVVIEPKYEWTQAFSNDKAIVEISKGHFGIIDKEGKLLKEIYNDRIISLSEDIFVFSKLDSDNREKYGYMTVDGKVMLDDIYSYAQEYEEGLAIVNASKNYVNEYGVINKKGEFVIPAKYAQIISLSNGIYAVPKAHDDYYDINFLKKAMFDKTGKKLTEFKYYNLEMLENGLISASDDKNTYLIDEKGNEVNSIPKAEGIGSIKSCGKLYKVEVDNELYYLTQDGKTVWTSDNEIRYDGGLEVKMKTFRPDRCMLIQYPEIVGLTDLKVQENINMMLKDKFVGNDKASNKDGEMFTDSIEINYTVDKNKDLLIISKTGYFYPIGAAHGQPTRESYHIDIKTGKLYTLKDLFKNDSKYKKKLTEIIEGMIVRANKELGAQIYSEDIGDLEENSGFAIERDSIQIYFYPYAIACYAAGFPEFNINYDELKNLINIDGEFCKSFERDPSAQPEKSTNEISASEKVKIEEAIKSYENSMVAAINKNNFKLVEPWLYTESSLYISQKKLVADLNQKQIKERLDGYSVEAMVASNLGMTRVYVTENIGIQYPGKDYTTKQFNWVYSLIYSYENQKYQLTYIDEWEKK